MFTNFTNDIVSDVSEVTKFSVYRCELKEGIPRDAERKISEQSNQPGLLDL